jgi:heavy metal sensor kinase
MWSMPKSLRWRLQTWYGLVLLAVVASFGGILYWGARAVRREEADRALLEAVHYLDVCLRRFPPREFSEEYEEGFWRPPPRPVERGFDWRPAPPPHEGRERLLAELDLPPRPSHPGPRVERQMYFAVWRADGSLLKQDALPANVEAPKPAAVEGTVRPRLFRRGEYCEVLMIGPGATTILAGLSVRADDEDLRALAWQLAGVGGIVWAAGLAGGWLISGRILRPISAMSSSAAAISATNLSQRIETAELDEELRGLAKTLNATFGRLEAAFQRQARFTADASHELRTPLAVIRTSAELALARPRQAQDYRETIESCLRAANRMAALVEGLLTLARAEVGKLELLREQVDWTQVIEDAVTLIQPLADEKAIELSSQLDPVEVEGDAGRLAQVATNLLSNAVRYTPATGSVEVKLVEEAGSALLSVHDTGPGIPEADQPHLFERFYRVDPARARSSGGSGLGLAICKSIVEAHGGAIELTSKLGKGSTFCVRLPALGGRKRRRSDSGFATPRVSAPGEGP